MPKTENGIKSTKNRKWNIKGNIEKGLKMDDLLVIRIDKKNRFIKIFDGNVSTDISYYSDFEICNEEPDSDCEDFNDNARWIAKTILKIMQLEDIDPDAHADWSADYDHNKDTGKYIFNVEFLEKDNL